jgi:Flp pilus assembly pilin Flp
MMWWIRCENWLRRPFLRERERGAAFTEYALLLALVAVGVIVAVTAFRDQLGSIFDSITSELASAGG